MNLKFFNFFFFFSKSNCHWGAVHKTYFSTYEILIMNCTGSTYVTASTNFMLIALYWNLVTIIDITVVLSETICVLWTFIWRQCMNASSCLFHGMVRRGSVGCPVSKCISALHWVFFWVPQWRRSAAEGFFHIFCILFYLQSKKQNKTRKTLWISFRFFPTGCKCVPSSGWVLQKAAYTF